MRDTLLSAAGELDLTAGGKPTPLEDIQNRRRSVYGFVSRRKLDGALALFDFPNPNISAERRTTTATPLQQLFFLNSEFLTARAKALTSRLPDAKTVEERIQQAYRLVFGREATAEELRLGRAYIAQSKDAWMSYAQVLLSSNELVFVN